MRKISLFPFLFFALLGLQPALAQQPLTNADIIKMAKAKLPDAVIIAEIKKSKCECLTTPDALINLKEAGVSDAVLEAMTGARSAPAGVQSEAPARDIGVYYRKAGDWTTVPPEVVNWKTGGVLKSMATVHIVKGDINGEVRGKDSPTAVATPAEFLFVVPQGAYITEYQLIHLHEHGNRREFRTVTGGVLHVSGGATRDVIPFTGKEVRDRTFRVTIEHLDTGEYGFLPPGNNATRQAMSSLGAMYTFHVIE